MHPIPAITQQNKKIQKCKYHTFQKTILSVINPCQEKEFQNIQHHHAKL